MADWKNISADTWKIDYKDAAGTNMSGKVRLTLQYDAASETPTSVKIRFKLDRTNTSSHYYDSMFVLYNANNDPSSIGRKSLRVKAYQSWEDADWPYYSSSITITKTYTAAKFTIQDVWLCNGGNGTWNSDDKTLKYASGTKSLYNWFKSDGTRQNYAYRQSSSTSIAISSSTTVATAVGNGTVSITDNGDNTFTLKGAKGANGTNNKSTGPTLSWGYTNDYGNSFSNGDKKTLSIKTASNATRTVYAKCYTGATYGSGNTVTASKAIKQYVAPSKPSGIKLTYSKSRLTIKENWTLEWTGGTKTNDSSPIKGYRIRIYKNGNTIKFKNSKGEVLTDDAGSGADRYYYDRDNTETTMNINTSTNTFAPGDKVKVLIHTYTKNADGKRLFSDGVWSSEYTVKHAGIMRVKADGKWVEGQVYVKADGKWVEADVVKVKADGKWVEAN